MHVKCISLITQYCKCFARKDVVSIPCPALSVTVAGILQVFSGASLGPSQASSYCRLLSGTANISAALNGKRMWKAKPLATMIMNKSHAIKGLRQMNDLRRGNIIINVE